MNLLGRKMSQRALKNKKKNRKDKQIFLMRMLRINLKSLQMNSYNYVKSKEKSLMSRMKKSQKWKISF